MDGYGIFVSGVQLLLRELPLILNGSAAEKAKDQDHTRATHAPKVVLAPTLEVKFQKT